MGAHPDAERPNVSGAGLPVVEIPHLARAHLAHAVLQVVADEVGVPLLHLKGPALAPGIRPPGHLSTDADVLVAPGRLGRLEQALAERGWRRIADVESGSAFAHAATWRHLDWGHADLHVQWPGPTVTDEETFSILGEDAFDQPIAHVPCRVPGRTAQILVLLLHAARTAGSADVEYAWNNQTEEQRAAVTALADRLGAQVPLAAALGDLETYRDDATYDLWRFYREGGGRLDEWRARYRAAATPAARRRVLLGALRVNRDHLGLRLGRAPTRAEVAAAQLGRVRTVGRELVRFLRGSGGSR